MTTTAVRRPLVARTRAELVDALAATRDRGGRVALVPTMGALHAGHAALVDEARARVTETDAVVVSVFVNPLQFGAGEDLDRYPRTFEADLEVCREHGADVVFAPGVDEVYPGGDPQVTVEPGPLGSVLEGATRPGHYRGVLTVVAKLFGLVRPDVAVFGQKDFQQLVLIRRMVSDLCLGVDVVGAETVREESGLALSSRNAYLDQTQKQLALALSRALRAGAAAGPEGAERVLAEATAVLGGRGRCRRRLPRAHVARARPAPVVRRGAAARRRPGRPDPADRQHRGRPGRPGLMLRTMMKSKIHRATVTQADLHYVGSVTVDEDLLDAADLLPGELVHIVDVTNGARLETYTIRGERGSGVIGINGAAAHLVHPGDLVILIAYAQLETAEARAFEPSVVFVDADNRVVATGHDPADAVPGSGLLRGDALAR